MSSKFWISSREFWLASTERAVKTLAQTLLALAAGQAFNAFSADWQSIIGISLGAAILSYVTSIVSAEVGEKGSPSLV